MAEPFLGEIRIFTGNYAPRGWALCDGQVLSISQNSALFALLGVTYGGNGTTTFQLPDLQSRAPIHPGQGPGLSPYTLGQTGGDEAIRIAINEMPPHAHMMAMPVNTGEGGTPDPTNAYLANSSNYQYASQPGDGLYAPTVQTGRAGGDNMHSNIQPYQCVNFIIALQGIFPQRP